MPTRYFWGRSGPMKRKMAWCKSIEFTAYREMAEKQYAEIREELFDDYSLSCMHVYHSLGDIRVGEINLFVFVSSKHRKDATEACRVLVEKIKNELPIWGKEILGEDNYSWKVNR
ncbi:MAG: molybdenum cofactor biosynthesis protein MoaE [Balneolaceae bacterium]|nr:molybdenum cofactor biosynthesis protein MoaE [Balneolaceae bacterium]